MKGCSYILINSRVQSLGPRIWIRTLDMGKGGRKEGREKEPTLLEEIPKDCSRDMLATSDLVLV